MYEFYDGKGSEYELKRQVEWILGEALNSNHLYPALRRYEEMGAIFHEVERQSGRPDRHVYHLTEQGKDVLRTLLRVVSAAVWGGLLARFLAARSSHSFRFRHHRGYTRLRSVSEKREA